MITRKTEALELDRYLGSELPSGGLDSKNGDSAAIQNSTAVDTREAKTDNADAEREQQLERWMDQVKLFIRNIDVNSL
ncbi:MAG: hypothetical protein AB9873_03750 [Syntrophobacteraceae bacterium]